jgi:hypothetical protein
MPEAATLTDTASAQDFVGGETPAASESTPADQSIEQWAKDITKSVFADEKPKATPEPEKPKAEVAAPDPAKDKPNPAELLKPGSKDYNWNQLKTEKERLAAEVVELKAKLASPETQAQLEALQKERDELSKRLEESDIERHPRFQQHYDGSLKRIAETAKQVVPGETGEKIADMLKTGAFRTNDAAFKELISTLDSAELAQVGALMLQSRTLHIERADELARAGERKKQLQAQEEAAKVSESKRVMAQFEANIREIASADPLFSKRDGDEAWNSAVDKRITSARDLMTSDLDAKSVANVAIWATVGPEYKDMLETQMAINAKMKQQIELLSAASPKVSGNQNGQQQAQQSKVAPADESWEQMMKRVTAEAFNSQ